MVKQILLLEQAFWYIGVKICGDYEKYAFNCHIPRKDILMNWTISYVTNGFLFWVVVDDGFLIVSVNC